MIALKRCQKQIVAINEQCQQILNANCKSFLAFKFQVGVVSLSFKTIQLTISNELIFSDCTVYILYITGL